MGSTSEPYSIGSSESASGFDFNPIYRALDGSLPDQTTPPINRAPPEVLSSILMILCDPVDLDPWRIPSTIMLSKVCSYWHKVVVAHPSLWSSLEITFGSWINRPLKLKRLLELFMARSCRAPLTLILSLPYLSGVGVLTPAIDLLLRNSDRWFKVALDHTSSMKHPIFQSIQRPFTALRYLELHSVNGEHGLFKPNLFNDSPAAELHLAIGFYSGPVSGNGFDMPWTQIRSLQLSHCRPARSALLMLSFCQNVEFVKLCRLTNSSRDNHDSPIPHVNSNLTSLRIEEWDQDQISNIFNHLTTPRLSSLYIEGFLRANSRWTHTWDSGPLEMLLYRSSCVLTHLHLQGIPITGEQTISLLESLPALQRLYIAELERIERMNVIITDTFLDQLCVDPNNSTSPFLPNLTDISLVLHPGVGIDEHRMRHIVESRFDNSAVTSLQSLNLTFRGDAAPTPDLLSFSEGCERRGLRMRIVHLPRLQGLLHTPREE